MPALGRRRINQRLHRRMEPASTPASALVEKKTSLLQSSVAVKVNLTLSKSMAMMALWKKPINRVIRVSPFPANNSAPQLVSQYADGL